MRPPDLLSAKLLEPVAPELLQGLQGFLAFVSNMADLEAVFDIVAALAYHDVSLSAIAYLKFHPAIAQLFEERYIAPTPDLDALLKLPEGPLGFADTFHMRAAKLDPEFYRKVLPTDRRWR